MVILAVLGLFLFVIVANCQMISTPYLSFLEQNLNNNSYVDINQVGESGEGCSDCVQCRSELPGCCDRPLLANWFAPDGSRLPFPGAAVGINQNRLSQRADLRRANDATSPTGIYRCDVAFNVSNPSLMKTLYIGLYTSNGGDIAVSDDVILTVDSDLNGKSPQFTLTCTSTGGPATTVTWTRNSTILTEGNVTVLDDPVTANYTHTLTVTERLPGLYSCTVANNKPSTDSTSFTVQEASAPTDLNSTIGEDSTSVLLTWTPPTPLGYTTGYRISFTDGGGNDEVADVSDGSTDNYTLTGLRRGEVYTISIVGLSEHFFSQRVSWDPIMIPTLPPPTTMSTSGSETPGRRGENDNSGAIVAGILIPLILIAIITVLVLLIVMYKRRKSKGTSYIQSSRPTPPVQYNKTNISERYTHTDGFREKAPVIVVFPDDRDAEEGEGVVFRVKVTGVPHPKLTWYHNGVEVVADYSTELAEDGSLTFPSAEIKHSGVYKLVINSPAGSDEKEVRLRVEGEGGRVREPPVSSLSAVPISRLANHVEKNHRMNNKGFNNAYKTLYDGADKTIKVASNAENKRKNRFANICVYDDNWVKLQPLSGYSDYGGDYINASYVDGYSIPKKFLATQGPLPKTLVDFWRLMWQERPPSIVMITNLEEGGKTKCQRYWPETGRCNFGPFEVTLTDEQIFADYTIRKLEARLQESSERPLRVTHFHFTAWPDHGVPDYATPLLSFHRRVIKEHKPKKGPLLVHCSAGVGRTGTFITIDHVLEQVGKERVVDIPGVINNIRHQRMKLVQTVDQYIFIHDAILESVTCGDTQIEASHLRQAIRKLRQSSSGGGSGFQQQFSILEKVSPNPTEVKATAALNNPAKNRSKDFLPMDRWRVVLKGETPDYINASVVHGYKQQRAFIIAQSPMQSTTRDFWKMICDKKCGVVVMLCGLQEDGEKVCYEYWPRSGSQKFGEFTVQMVGEESHTGFTIRNFNISNIKSNEVSQVSQFQITNWSPDGTNSNIKTVIDVIHEVVKVQIRTGNKPIVVHCSDTVSRSGMFCAIATTIERCKTEGVVDVFQMVKALRVQKPAAVLTLGQYKAVFESILVFLDSFETYSNFGQ